MAISDPLQVLQYLGSTSVTTTGAQALTGTVPVGAILLVTVIGNGGTATYTVSDSKSHTWTAVTITRVTSGAANSAQMFYTRVTSEMTTSDTITTTRSAGGVLGVHAHWFSGVRTVTPLDNSGTTPIANAANTATPAVAALTVSAGSVVLAHTGTQDNRTVSALASGYTSLHDAVATWTSAPRRSVLIYARPTGSTTPSMTLNSGGAWCMSAIAFAAEPDPEPEITTPWYAITSEGLVPLELSAL